jgi:hypothetical protein
MLEVQILPSQPSELTTTQRGSSGGSHHDADCKRASVAENRPCFINSKNVGIAPSDGALAHRCNRVELGIKLVPYAVREQGTHVVAEADQEKRRREEAIAQTAGMRVLKAIGDAVPVRLMKRDLLFVAERLTAMLDERRLSVLIRQHGIGKPRDNAAPAKLMAAFLPKAEESKLGRIW